LCRNFWKTGEVEADTSLLLLQLITEKQATTIEILNKKNEESVAFFFINLDFPEN
jgi:hypothetical protein